MARRKVVPAEGRAFIVRSSRIAGKGAFALRRIKKGERIIEYAGERISHAVADVRYDDEHIIPHHTFLFTVSRTTVIDAAVDGNDSRYINHSCEPNCESVIDHSRVYIEAIRRVQPGEELAYDYAYVRDGTETEEEETGKYGCRCGAKRCRGSILAPLSARSLARREAAKRRQRAAAP